MQVRPRGTDRARCGLCAGAARAAAVALAIALGLDLTLLAGRASAFTVNLTAAAPKEVYLQVGNGLFTGGNYTPIHGNGQPTGTPGVNTTINVMSVSVPANAVGNSTAQTMSTNSTAANSYWDGFLFCNLAQQQLYIGGFYRTPGNSGAGTTATVTATLPASLTDGAGDTVPFTQISWTSGGNGDSGAEPFPAGSFTGTSLVVGSIANNQWAESCWTFSYKNSIVPAAGTFTGRVTYTLSAP
jgi:hypothetical protein